MELYFRQLVRKLDSKNKYWRQTTVIMLDNAKYHVSQTTSKVLELLDIPVLFTGPHSYSSSPVETMLALFKSQDINPR